MLPGGSTCISQSTNAKKWEADTLTMHETALGRQEMRSG